MVRDLFRYSQTFFSESLTEVHGEVNAHDDEEDSDDEPEDAADDDTGWKEFIRLGWPLLPPHR